MCSRSVGVLSLAVGVVLAHGPNEPAVNAATWVGFSDPRRMASAEASTCVMPVPPVRHGAVVGTFVADGSFAFPFETLVRTVDTEAVLALPVDESVAVRVDGDALSVAFTEDDGDGARRP